MIDFCSQPGSRYRISSKQDHVEAFYPDADGAYEVTLEMKGTATEGTYIIRVNGNFLENPIEKEVAFYEAAQIVTLWDQLFSKVINGKGNGIFDPDALVTREEFVKMLVLAFEKSSEGASVGFEDVAKQEWYYPYIASAHEQGLVKGVSESRFGVGDYITRQDMAVLVWRFADSAGAALPEESMITFIDKAQIAEYARNSVGSLREAGIVNGMPDGSFAPLDLCTRAQAAKIIYTTLDYSGFVKEELK